MGMNFYVPQALPQAFQGGGMLPMQPPVGWQAPGLTEGECPWQCLINETVATMGRSNEDDAIYELFYTNPLNCCGTIVELGVVDGLENSTSYFFERGMNWTTILTEADPTKYSQLIVNRPANKTTTINGAFCKEGPYLYFDGESRSFQSPANDDYSSELMNADFEKSD